MIATGIYEILNTSTGKRYVGSAVNFKKRWYSHRRLLEKGTHWSNHLQAAWSKHGAASFVFKPILICDKLNLLIYEQIAIDALSPEYNKCPVAGSTLGFKFSPESLARMSKAHSAENLSPETRAKMSASQRKRTHPPEVRAKLSVMGLGRKLSPEECERRSQRMKGNVHSEETKRKISASLTGKKLPPEQIAKLVISSTGRRHTAEAKARIAAAQKGNKHCLGRVLSAETRAKQSAAHRGRIKSPEHIANISAAKKGKKRGPMSEEQRAKHAAGIAAYWQKRRNA